MAELDGNGDMVKTCIYANEQLLAACDETGQNRPIHFYLHDRLGSVRQILSSDHRTVQRYYTYSPFGRLLQTGGSQTQNIPLRFTGQWFDDEISQYYLRARMYDPDLTRFTTRDPVFGTFKHPLTLHKYLYCLNDPINRTDPQGRLSYSTVAGNLFIRSLLAGGFNSLITGTRSYASGGSFLKGAASGFAGGFAGALAGGYFASASAAGYIAAAVSGGVTSGFESALKAEGVTLQAFERVLVDTIYGAILGVGNKAAWGWAFDQYYAATGVRSDVAVPIQDDVEKKIVGIWESIHGGTGANIWTIISAELFGDFGHKEQ